MTVNVHYNLQHNLHIARERTHTENVGVVRAHTPTQISRDARARLVTFLIYFLSITAFP